MTTGGWVLIGWAMLVGAAAAGALIWELSELRRTRRSRDDEEA